MAFTLMKKFLINYKLLILSMLMILFIGNSIAMAQTGIWPMFRFNAQHHGVTDLSGPFRTGEEKWRFSIPSGQGIFTSPTVWAPSSLEEVIYFGAMDGKLYSINEDGELRWSYDTGAPIFSSPAVINTGLETIILFGNDNYFFYALIDQGDHADLKWTYSTTAPIASSPVIGAEKFGQYYYVYFGCNNNKLYGLSINEGTLIWSAPFSTSGPIYSSPVVDVSDSGETVVYVGSSDDSLYCVDIAKGISKWTTPAAFTTNGDIFSSPAIGSKGAASQDLVYFGSRDGYLYCVTSDTTFVTPSKVWSYQTNDDIYSSPAVVIPTPAQKAYPAITTDIVVFGSSNKYVYALTSLDGINATVLWKKQLPAAVNSSPAIDANLNTYIGCDNGYLYCLDPYGNIAWKFYVGSSMSTSPAISNNGTIYVTTANGDLIAIGSSAVPLPSWRLCFLFAAAILLVVLGIRFKFKVAAPQELR